MKTNPQKSKIKDAKELKMKFKKLLGDIKEKCDPRPHTFYEWLSVAWERKN